MSLVKKIPGKVLIEINKKVGFRLATKMGEKGLINLGKVIPLLGGGIGGCVNAVGALSICKAAKMVFSS